MKVRYDNSTLYITDDSGLNISQSFDPKTGKRFENIDDATEYLFRYIKEDLKSSIIYFEMSVFNEDGELADINNISKDEIYVVTLKESTGRLTGKYDIIFRSQDFDMVKTFTFMDGEASRKLMFNLSNEYKVILDNKFTIGQDTYLTLIDEMADNSFETFSSKQVSKDFLLVIK